MLHDQNPSPVALFPVSGQACKDFGEGGVRRALESRRGLLQGLWLVESAFEANREVVFSFRFSLEASLFLVVFWFCLVYGIVGFVWMLCFAELEWYGLGFVLVFV